MNLSTMTTQWILDDIEHWNHIQRNHNINHPLWNEASEKLQPLFKEMAKRTSS